MQDIRVATLRAIHDALSIRGVLADGGGFIRTAPAESYMDPDRLRLAKEVARQLPADATRETATLYVERLCGLVIHSARPDEQEAGARGLT